MEIIFRKLGTESAGMLAQVESECFPPAEAAGEKDFIERLQSPAFVCFGAFSTGGELIGFINGASYDKPQLPDELYHDTGLFREDGKWQTVFGVDVREKYRRQGAALEMLKYYETESIRAGRQGIVLTCKTYLRPLYEKAGYVWQGVSASTHGNAEWNDMLLLLPDRHM